MMIRYNVQEPTDGRLVDASAYLHTGTAMPPLGPVRSDGPDLDNGLYIQVGAFAQRMNAEALRARVEREVTEFSGRGEIVLRGAIYRVLVGPFDDPGAAAMARDRLADLLDSEALIVDRR